jgi:hypothetical protein
MTSSKGADSYHMDIIVNGLSGNFLWGLEKTANIHVKSKIGKTTGYNLGTTIMTVLTHLCNEDSWISAFVLGEVLYSAESSFELVLTLVASLGGCLFAVCASYNVLFGNMSAKHVFKSLRDFSNGSASLSSFNCKSKHIFFSILAGLSELFKESLNMFVVSAALDLVNPINLLLPDF